ncbi:MAG: diguanylate cyclase [Myxococcales bacterium]
MTRRHRVMIERQTAVLLVDDDAEFLLATSLLLESEGYSVLRASCGTAALELLETRHIDVMLVDYWMPDTNGERLVEEIRRKNRELQIVLLTGYANERPPRELLRTLDIQGFCDKGEGPERVLLWTDVAAKAAAALAKLRDSQRALDGVLEGTRMVHSRREKNDLYAEILLQMVAHAGADGALLSLFPDALGEDGDLVIDEATGTGARVVASVGSLAGARDWIGILAPDGFGVVRQSISSRSTQIGQPWIAVPLRVGEHVLGFVAMKVSGEARQFELELLDVLAHQASVALQNSLYYEMAALDTLTGVHARRFFDVWARREVRAAVRNGTPVGLLLIDLDGLKAINDQGGHRIGDLAIRSVGRVLRDTTREHDLAARLGGDEFAMLMPATDMQGALTAARRILDLLREKTVLVQGRSITVSASIGVSVLQSRGPCPPAVGRTLSPDFFEELLERLVRHADEALYQAKRDGKGRVHRSEAIDVPWTSTERPPARTELA